jgi:hypothetical protein
MTDIIRKRLKNMKGWAEIRRRNMADLKKEAYVRIGGNGFRAVSVASDSPLTGFSQKSDPRWDTVMKHFEKKTKPIEGGKEERRLQAFMIRYALKNKLSIRDLIGCDFKNVKFEDVVFAFDEISLGDRNNAIRFHEPFDKKEEGIIRCDLLCVGIREGKGYPLLIELKYNRSQTRLIEQLKEFEYQISQEYKDEFENLLKAATGLEEVDCSTVYKAVIWPKLKSGKPRDATAKKFEESNVQVFAYESKKDQDYLVEATFNIE